MQTLHDEMREVSQVVVRLHATVLAMVGAVVTGMGLFIMTVWLVLKGGPQVGMHLQLLRHYFLGYSVELGRQPPRTLLWCPDWWGDWLECGENL
jgi:hypothetical protein